MKNLRQILKRYSGKTLLAIFAHPDDESFVSGGLFQVADEYDIRTSLICLTKGERGINAYKKGDLKRIREKELRLAVAILGIDELYLWDYPDARLKNSRSKWVEKLGKTIQTIKPDIVLTFDHSGITGHPDHIILCVEVLDLIKKLGIKPVLFWRVPDKHEIKIFKKNEALIYRSEATHKLKYTFKEAIKKIKAIYSHRSQMQGTVFKLRILEWFLFDHFELYCKVNMKKKYTYKFVFYKI